MSGSNQPPNNNLDLDPELEGGTEFDIIYFDDEGILVERDLLALNNSQHSQLDLVRWMKNAEQRKLGQQQLKPEDGSNAAALHQSLVSKGTVRRDKLRETPTPEDLPAQVSAPTSPANEFDDEIDRGTENVEAKPSESKDEVVADNLKPSKAELEVRRFLKDKIRHVVIPMDQLKRHFQVCPQHAEILRSMQQRFGESGQLHGKLVGTLLIFGSSFAAASLASSTESTRLLLSCSSWCPPEGYPKWDYNWDKRDPHSLIKPSKKRLASGQRCGKDEEDHRKQVGKEKCQGMRHLFLVRHGQYKHNRKDDSERGLTELGKRQAEETGKRLLSLGVDYDCLVTSTMTRAIQTAHIIQKVIGKPEIISQDPMLAEGAPAQADPPFPNWHPEKRKNQGQDSARIEAAFHKYFHRPEADQTEDSYEIIVGHGNVIRYFFCRALQFPGEAWSRICLNHASLTWLIITPSGRVIVRALGDSGHLDPEMLTTS